MKQSIATLTFFLATQITWAHSLTSGHYEGKGLWKSLKAKGQYTVSAEVGASTIQTVYTLQDGSTRQAEFIFKETAPGFFAVSSHGKTIGSGYCLEKAPVCHYEISIKHLKLIKLEETLVQEGKKVYRFGSKDEGHGRIVWQESLSSETTGKE